MTEKRNNDWTDKLRERLSDSEMSPSADLWSKVEGATAPSRKAVPAAAWWGLAFAAAAVAAVLFVPKGGKVVDVVPEPLQTITAEAVTVEDNVEVEEQCAPMAAVAEVVESETSATAENPEDASVADTGVAPTSVESPDNLAAAELAAADAPAVQPDSSVQPDASSVVPAVADVPASVNEPEPEYGFGTFAEEISKPRKKVAVSLFASGIPGHSGLNSRPDLYIVQPGTSASVMYGAGGLSSLINSNGNASIVVVDDNNGSFAYNAGPGIKGITDGVNGGTEYYLMPGYEVRHHRPVSVGVSFTYPLVRNLFLESGLSYTFLRSEYAGKIGDQRLHFLGVPLKLGYRFNTPSNFSVSLSAGAMAEKCIYGELFGRRITVKEPQFSAVATASVNYGLGQHLSLFVAPELDYYFTGTAVPTYRTERPLSMTLRLGVNLNIGK